MLYNTLSVNSGGKLTNKAFDTVPDAMRFHMPGHSGHDIGVSSADDVTELSYSGNLIESAGRAAEIERNAARIYGAKHALLFTSGATSAINAAVLTTKQIEPRPTITLSGTPHKSLFSYMRIHGLPYISDSEYKANPDALKGSSNVLFHTSPDYYGRYAEPDRRIDAEIKIIDASHAAHYAFSCDLPKITLNDYDVIIYSLHKTLPVLTGGALILTDNDEYYNHLLLARMRTHSTSPSFMTLSSVAYALDALRERGASDYAAVKNGVDEFIALSPFKAYYYDDFSRLTIDLCARSAESINDYLENNGCFVEMVNGDKLVLIVTPYNYMRLKDLAELLNKSPEPPPLDNHTYNARVALNFKENSTKIGTVSFVEPSLAAGKVSANEIGVYPPGLPEIYGGEIISEESLEFIKKNIDRAFGLIGGKIAVYD